jgi:hypothetical protein
MVAKRLPKNGDLIYLNGGSEIATPKMAESRLRSRKRGRGGRRPSESTKAVRRSSHWHRVFLCCRPQLQSLSEAYLGASVFLPKPYRGAHVVATLRELTGAA